MLLQSAAMITKKLTADDNINNLRQRSMSPGRYM